MYSNINSRWGGEFAVTGGAITASTNASYDISIPSVDPTTMVVDAVMFVDEADLAKTSTAEPVIRAYISAVGVVTVSVTALFNTVTVASGAKVRVVISQNDNCWDSSGL